MPAWRTSALVVGFDLDMTLLDARRGIVATYAELAAETGVMIDGKAAARRLGPPLEDEIVRWFPADEVAARVVRYRELYAIHAVGVSEAMPHACAAVAAVRRHGGRVVAVTAKSEALARASLDRIGIEVDQVCGQRFAEAKGDAIQEHGVDVFVGDHVGDVIGARAGEAFSVSVATGPSTADELRAAGTDVLLPDLAAFPDWLSAHVRGRRLSALEAELRALDSVLVAFSGGADSAFLLAAAARVLGAESVVAVTAVSASLPAAELDGARAFTAALGVRHLLAETEEMSRDGYRANGADRCYFCKAELIDTLSPLAAELGIAHVVTGTNADDAVAGFRPGIRAAADRGARTPLRDAGLTKAQIRTASREWGLSTWDKPAAACLASRIAYGISVSPHRLARVERAETALRTALREAGTSAVDLRVRDLGDRARIEVDTALAAALTAHPGPITERLLDVVRAAGFIEVEIDPRGFRSGSMNELLAATQPD